MKAIRIHQFGDVDVLRYEDVPVPDPGEGMVRVKIAVVGVNFIDIYHRTGFYKNNLPFTPGMEAAGTVDAVGADVREINVGDRVACAMSPGAYAQYSIVPAWKLVPIPAGIELQLAAAVMLQGMTAHYLTHHTYAVQPGDTVLVHAAAGGTGSLIVQMARLRGARVIGTVSSPAKGAVAREAGADEVIIYTENDFEAEVKEICEEGGVNVVYDSVGKETYEKSINCLKPRGFMVLFGQSSGPVPPIDPLVLSAKGSLYLTRPSLVNYTSTRKELLSRTKDIFYWIASGQLKVRIAKTFSLAEAGLAHRALSGRQVSGKIVLLV